MSQYCTKHKVSHWEGCRFCKIVNLEAELARLRPAAQALLDAQTDRWAAQSDHECFAANAMVVATHDALLKELDPVKPAKENN